MDSSYIVRFGERGDVTLETLNGGQVDELARRAVMQKLLMETLPTLNELYQEAERETRWRQLVGERIRKLREAREWSQEQLALESKTRRDIVDDLECGRPYHNDLRCEDSYEWSLLTEIAVAFSLSIEELVEG